MALHGPLRGAQCDFPSRSSAASVHTLRRHGASTHGRCSPNGASRYKSEFLCQNVSLSIYRIYHLLGPAQRTRATCCFGKPIHLRHCSVIYCTGKLTMHNHKKRERERERERARAGARTPGLARFIRHATSGPQHVMPCSLVGRQLRATLHGNTHQTPVVLAERIGMAIYSGGAVFVSHRYSEQLRLWAFPSSGMLNMGN
jgi:hypothetical protein